MYVCSTLVKLYVKTLINHLTLDSDASSTALLYIVIWLTTILAIFNKKLNTITMYGIIIMVLFRYFGMYSMFHRREMIQNQDNHILVGPVPNTSFNHKLSSKRFLHENQHALLEHFTFSLECTGPVRCNANS